MQGRRGCLRERTPHGFSIQTDEAAGELGYRSVASAEASRNNLPVDHLHDGHLHGVLVGRTPYANLAVELRCPSYNLTGLSVELRLDESFKLKG